LLSLPGAPGDDSLQNHKSNAKSALLYLAREKGVPEHGAPLMEEWEALKAKIEGSLVRHRLSSFMRFCSANTIKPGEVNDSVVERFIDCRSRCGKPADSPFRRVMARAWNANVGRSPAGRTSSSSSRRSSRLSRSLGATSRKGCVGTSTAIWKG
jgi:hypothetical protein